MEIGFDFLKPGRSTWQRSTADAPDADYAENPEAYRIRSGRVTARSRLSVWMARGGGFAISLREAAPADRRLPKLK
ncbi:glycoside hydrolase family 97 C-terminal domain-containing protein [Alistipes sp. An116]|uniref:glycoside hydrolase family 97 C-terminal domain-containing protein n=1 Tax=Alistipes sp. An116 TaxID=1965546 RepID=UPI001EF66A6B|nr:glycoside hydrolase family 97 C-terminal domain-containing protein [Alistipes sp. An116]